MCWSFLPTPLGDSRWRGVWVPTTHTGDPVKFLAPSCWLLVSAWPIPHCLSNKLTNLIFKTFLYLIVSTLHLHLALKNAFSLPFRNILLLKEPNPALCKHINHTRQWSWFYLESRQFSTKGKIKVALCLFSYVRTLMIKNTHSMHQDGQGASS